MQLVIEISDTLKDIADNEDTKAFSHIIWQALLMDAIKNGQPLPKGHGSLIDQDALIGKIHGVRSITAVLDATVIIEADGGAE